MRTTVFKIEGMNCGACADRIKTVIDGEPGVQMAYVSFPERQARVLYDANVVREEQLVAAIQKAGFRIVASEALGDSAS
jgi:copper chaperone CopZ